MTDQDKIDIINRDGETQVILGTVTGMVNYTINRGVNTQGAAANSKAVIEVYNRQIADRQTMMQPLLDSGDITATTLLPADIYAQEVEKSRTLDAALGGSVNGLGVAPLVIAGLIVAGAVIGGTVAALYYKPTDTQASMVANQQSKQLFNNWKDVIPQQDQQQFYNELNAAMLETAKIAERSGYAQGKSEGISFFDVAKWGGLAIGSYWLIKQAQK